MFILQKQLSVLNVPSSRVAVLYCSGGDIQLALPELPSQMGSAYLVMLKGGGKVQVLVGLYMAKSRRNIFYVSDAGEVPVARAAQELEAGQFFAESMGFILNDSDFGMMSAAQQDSFWKSLPICQRHSKVVAEAKAPEVNVPVTTAPEVKRAEVVQAPSPSSEKSDLATKRKVLRERLGKLLGSL